MRLKDKVIIVTGGGVGVAVGAEPPLRSVAAGLIRTAR